MNTDYEWRHRVTSEEIDELGRANNEAYLHWLNEAAKAHSTALGWPPEAYFQRGQGWVVRRHEIEYLRPAWPETDIIVRTWVRTLDKASSWRAYEVLAGADRTLLVRGQTLWAWINYQTGRPSRVPPEVAAAFPVRPDTSAD